MSDAAASAYPTISSSQPPAEIGGGAVGTALARFRDAHREPIRVRTVAAAVGVGIGTAVLVVGHQPGLGIALAALLVWLPALPALVRRRAWSVLATAGLGIALASMTAVRAAEWVVVLCLLAAVGTCAVAATQARSVLGVGLAVPTMPVAAVRALRWAWSTAGGGVSGRRGQVLGWLRTGLVTLVLLVVFGTLLASADAVFATLLPRWDLALLPGQVVVAVLAASTALAVVSLAVQRPAWSDATLPRPTPATGSAWLIPVLALDLLMLVFLLTQVVAAVGGDDYVRATAGLTYAAYARQGFGQLVAVTLLTLAVVAWFAARAPRREDGSATWHARVVLGVLCLAALGIVATALQRISLYVDAYGLTEMRILAIAGEVVMGVVLLLVLVGGVRWRGGWLPLAVVRVMAVAVLGLAIANPDALIVRYNTQATEVPLDVWHLRELSDDAVPALAELDEPLRSCLLGWHDPDLDPSPWGWNLARDRAAAVDDVTDPPDCTPIF